MKNDIIKTHSFFVLFFVCYFCGANILLVHAAGITEEKQIRKQKYLQEAYLSDSSSHYMFGISGIRMHKYFEPDAKEVVWIGRFNMWANMKAEFIAKWYSPDGAIFKREPFSHIVGSTLYSIASMTIKNNISKDLYGKWKVVIFWDNEKIDEKYFYIDTKPNLEKDMKDESQLW